ncbi:glycerol-3-phosphate cytidylyltransferase [Shewanella intestini]|uniref:Glycerol-3-phosphate cytidylyltransferase n=1 Tax=Shewanella intestini TaxID=2017544 RepID=A0ABS5HYH0_9GAMM|nr:MULTISPECIES: glycerol-3-phosphate cytidylyltransferase [Shewanella]MBR9726814.1 glycerol-3-phosphate cytidylyltransferase [Shewanella intestini]MRG34620.1 glycerol-3-phosphate cytidylyltransferase [Shewanella sp. XMDDZSB0408]
MKTILTYGTFDLFHVGHIRLFKRLSQLGDQLIVGVSTDEFNTLKNKSAYFCYQERREIVESCKYVDMVIPESNWQQKRGDIIRLQADIFAIGDDWLGKFDDLSDICKVMYLKRTKEISTTDIKKSLAVASRPQCLSA